jgi:glycosyltransferase involved in cell wall biosynthesis
VNSARPEKIRELSIVIPVYNEGETISDVVNSWVREMDRLEIDYELLVYNDGSRDKTGEVLEELGNRFKRILVRRHENIGHGPTILRGYREASGEWVFQVDGDGEMGPEQFVELWSRRKDFDLLLGCRVDRRSPFARRIITAVSRVTVRICFGTGILDVNTPYRLIRRTCLTRVLNYFPSDTFAPNVILSGLAVRSGWRIYQGQVPHRVRKSGTPSLVKWRQWKAAFLAFRQTTMLALKWRGLEPRK